MRAAGLFVWLAGSCQHLGGLSHLFPSPLHSLCSLTLPLSSHLHSCPTIRFSVVCLPYHANNIVVIHLFFFDISFYFVSPVIFNLFSNFYYISICSQILCFSFTLYFTTFGIQIRFLYISVVCLSSLNVFARRTCVKFLVRFYFFKEKESRDYHSFSAQAHLWVSERVCVCVCVWVIELVWVWVCKHVKFKFWNNELIFNKSSMNVISSEIISNSLLTSYRGKQRR